MKKLLAIALFAFVSLSAHADSIKCYSGDKVIYYRNISNVTYTGEVFIFTEKTSDRTVVYSGNCIVKIDV